jgi:integrase
MLTDTFLRALIRNPGPPRKLTDAGRLYLAVRPSGALLWRFGYSINGRQQTASFGSYPDVGLSKARALHREFKAKLAAGISPAVERRAAQHEAATKQPFRAVAADWLDVTVPQVRAAKTRQRAERSIAALNAVAGDIEIGAVRILDIMPALTRLEREGKFETRSRVQAHAKDIMNFAASRGLITMSPLAALSSKSFTPPTETKRPAITDAIEFGNLLRKIDHYEIGGHGLTGYALKLLALTFVRPGDVQRARWENFDLDAGLWSIPFAELKMRTHRKAADVTQDDYIVPLSRQAVALLRAIHAITGHSQFVFPGRQRARSISENTLNDALRAMGYTAVHCAHGFRSTASTLLNRERVAGRRRFEQSLIEIQLNHLDSSTRAIYDRDDCMPERIALMQFWADRIDEYRDGAKVVRLRPRMNA